MRILVSVSAAMAAWALAGWALAGAAAAADAKPDPYQCAVAYAAAGDEKGRAQGASYNKEKSNSLGDFIGNLSSISIEEFDRRADALGPAIEAASPGKTAFTAKLAANDVAQQMQYEAFVAAPDAILAPDQVFRTQREIFASARACDQAYGFTPVLDAAPALETVVARFRALATREADEKRDRLAALDDQQCVARFMVFGGAMAGDAELQRVMSYKMNVAAGKAMAAAPDLTQERLAQLVQRAGAELGSKIKTQDDFARLVEEVNACERRYAMPLTTKAGG